MIRFKGVLEEILTRIDALNQIKSYSTHHNSSSSSVEDQLNAEGTGKGAISDLILKPFLSDSHHRHLTTGTAEHSACESDARRQNHGSCHPLSRSVPRLCPPVSTLEVLYIFESLNRQPRWQDDVENTLWLDLLRSFVAVKNLYLSEKFVPRIAPSLQELVRGRTTEVLPIRENIFLESFLPFVPLHEGIEKFVAARRLTSYPVAVSLWDGQRKIYE
ncbi:hypothetical protein F5888DRAFT_1373845 [Russula emetica]|nr:hypothetical protein F5888DRAFT_1373845 [Russula emetica]